MAYQGTTYDPARLLPFIEEARRRKRSESDEREALMHQREMERQQMEMMKQEQNLKIKAQKRALEREEETMKAIRDFRETERQMSAGNPLGALNENIAQKNYIAMLGGTWTGGGGGGISFAPEADVQSESSGGGGQQQQQASSDPMAGMSKDARLGMQLWQQQLAGSEADANLERQKSAEGITQKNKAELLRAELDWKSTEAQKDRDQQSRLAGGQRYLDELQVEISSLPETTDEEAILKAQAVDSVNMYQNDPVMLKKILDAMRRQRANAFGKQMVGKTISSMSNFPGLDIRNLTPQGGR